MKKRCFDLSASWLSIVEADLLIEALQCARSQKDLSGVQRHQVDVAIRCLVDHRKSAKHRRVQLDEKSVRQILLAVASGQKWLNKMFDEYSDGAK